jgi:hypothetical protein
VNLAAESHPLVDRAMMMAKANAEAWRDDSD